MDKYINIKNRAIMMEMKGEEKWTIVFFAKW